MNDLPFHINAAQFCEDTMVRKSEPLTFSKSLLNVETKMVQNQEQNTTMIMASFCLKVKYQSSRSS